MALTLMPVLGADGELRLAAADRAGHWTVRVKIAPARISLKQGRLAVELQSWQPSREARTQSVCLAGVSAQHLSTAVRIVKPHLKGVDVVVTEAGIEVRQLDAESRERVESAALWLRFALQYLDAAACFGPRPFGH